MADEDPLSNDEDPLSDDNLDRYTPRVPTVFGDAHVGNKDEKDKLAARDEYRDLAKDNVLDKTVHSEGPFLAKMYVVAEHFGQLDEFKSLLERGMKLRADKVKAASKVFHSLQQIYKELAENGAQYWKAIDDKHFVGDAADRYHDEYATLTKYMWSGKQSLGDVAENTHKLTGEFSSALSRWQKELADAIREMAEYDRNTVKSMVEGWAIGLVTDDPFEAAKDTLEGLLYLFDRTDEKGRQSKALLNKIDHPEGFGLDDPLNDNVGYQQLNLPDPWDGKLP